MKKLNTFIVAFALASLTMATVSYATFEGGRNSLSIDAVIAALAGTYAELNVANIFQQDQFYLFENNNLQYYLKLR